MKLTKLLAGITLCLLASYSSVAQTTAEHCVAFSSWNKSDQSDLSAENAKALQVKIDQIISRNRAGSTSAANQLFVIYPEFVVTRTDLVESGLSPVSVVKADLSLFVVNKVDQSNYGSAVVALQGSGNTEQEAIRSMISRIQPSSGVFVNLIKKATAQIIDYYSNNMGRTLTQAQNLIAAERYDDALSLLGSVPVCVPAFEQSAEAIAELIKMVADKHCNAALVMAQRYMSIGDYDNAQAVLMAVKSGGSCDAEVQSLLLAVKAKQNSPAMVPPMVTAPSMPAPAPKAEAVVQMIDPFANLSFKFIDCSGNKADNMVVVTLLVTNVSDLTQKVNLSNASRGTMLYSEAGDSFECNGVEPRNFNLPNNLSQKMTFRFLKVGARTTHVSFMATFYDAALGNKVVEARNVKINW